jgi:hypothetical protein
MRRRALPVFRHAASASMSNRWNSATTLPLGQHAPSVEEPRALGCTLRT